MHPLRTLLLHVMRYRSIVPCLVLLACIASCQQPTIPTVGDVGTDFTMNDQYGKPVSLSQFRGKVVVLDFWATWCGPCMAELPTVKKTWEKYRDRDFMILSVSLDFDLDRWRTVIQDNHLDWTHVADGKSSNNAVAVKYGISAIPHVMVLDRQGVVRGEATNISRLDSTIVTLLNQ